MATSKVHPNQWVSFGGHAQLGSVFDMSSKHVPFALLRNFGRVLLWPSVAFAFCICGDPTQARMCALHPVSQRKKYHLNKDRMHPVIFWRFLEIGMIFKFLSARTSLAPHSGLRSTLELGRDTSLTRWLGMIIDEGWSWLVIGCSLNS